MRMGGLATHDVDECDDEGLEGDPNEDHTPPCKPSRPDQEDTTDGHAYGRRFADQGVAPDIHLEAFDLHEATELVDLVLTGIPQERRDRAEKVFQQLIVSASVAQNNKLDALLEQMVDPMTGALTKAAFQARVYAQLGEAHQAGDVVFLAVVDLTAFKKINDTYGHLVGDVVLVQAVDILRGVYKRKTDILGRSGGDEFTGFSRDGAGEDWRTCQAIHLEKLRDTFHDLRGTGFSATYEGREISFGIDIGWISCRLGGDGPYPYIVETIQEDGQLVILEEGQFEAGSSVFNPEEFYAALYKKADDAMYASKPRSR